MKTQSCNNDIYENISRMRNILKEDKDFNKEDIKSYKNAVPYSKQDELMSTITQTAKTQFGADFSKLKNPMFYYPEDGDVTLSGEIGTLDDAKFQFRYKDNKGGCYVWISPLNLTDETLRTLQVINGVYKNWKQSLAQSEDIKPMSMNGNEQTGMVAGDDVE